jgi:SNF2 family DNA or RNA helicase
MKFTPRPAQVATIERMVTRPYQMICLRMGGGKTASTLTAINELMYDRFEISKVLIVAPLRVAQLVWVNEAQKWDHTRHLKVSKVLGTAKQRVEGLTADADIHVINRENFTWLVKLVEQSKEAWPWDCVVIDENIGFKDRSSQAWKALKSVRKGIARLFILSGTPDPNGDLLDLWPQVSIMDGGQRLGKGITKYREQYYDPDKRNGMTIYSYKLKPGARDMIYDRVKDVVVSIDSGVTTPGRIDNVVQVKFDMARYRELEQTLVSGGIIAVNSAILAGKLAQMANGAVYDDQGNVHHIHDAKLEALGEIVEQGEPVLCLTSYVHDWDRIKKAFPQAVKFDGADSLKDWIAGKIDLLVMHPASGGHGVDGLQHAGSVIVWFGLPFSLDLYEQANARLDRSGQMHEVVVHHLVATGTIDERIMRVLSTKGNMQQALLDAVNEAKGK